MSGDLPRRSVARTEQRAEWRGFKSTKNTQFVFLCFAMYWWSLINPRRACAVRVTVVGSVCLCVCPLLNISPLERLFVSQSVPHTQRAAKVRNFVWFSLKMLRCRARTLLSLYGYALVGHFYSVTTRVCITMRMRSTRGILGHFVRRCGDV